MSIVYKVITDRIISMLEHGVVPWAKPWAGEDLHPRNLVSKKLYRGVNVFTLSSAGYSEPWWLSYKQALKLGGAVKKGERSVPVVYWNWKEIDDDKKGKIRVPFLRYYSCFNVEQCNNIDYPKIEPKESKFTPIEAAEKIIAEMPSKPKIEYKYNKAFYRPLEDLVGMPAKNQFETPESFYSTLLHEIVHASGHSSRLNRKGVTERHIFGDEDYSMEELIAECGSCYLCGHAGIVDKTIKASSSYINNWLTRLKGDDRMVVQAGSSAQRAADYILNKKFSDGSNEEPSDD